jgi:hypothetical protein
MLPFIKTGETSMAFEDLVRDINQQKIYRNTFANLSAIVILSTVTAFVYVLWKHTSLESFCGQSQLKGCRQGYVNRGCSPNNTQLTKNQSVPPNLINAFTSDRSIICNNTADFQQRISLCESMNPPQYSWNIAIPALILSLFLPTALTIYNNIIQCISNGLFRRCQSKPYDTRSAYKNTKTHLSAAAIFGGLTTYVFQTDVFTQSNINCPRNFRSGCVHGFYDYCDNPRTTPNNRTLPDCNFPNNNRPDVKWCDSLTAGMKPSLTSLGIGAAIGFAAIPALYYGWCRLIHMCCTRAQNYGNKTTETESTAYMKV